MSPMDAHSPSLLVLSLGTPGPADLALSRLAELLGLEAQFVEFPEVVEGRPDALQMLAHGARAIALGQAVLERCHGEQWFSNLLDEVPFIFVYGLRPDEEGEFRGLRWLTDEKVFSVVCTDVAQRQFTVAPDVGLPDFPVSGRSFSGDSGPAVAFSVRPTESAVCTYVSVNGQPHFVGVARGRSVLFLLAGDELVDIAAAVPPTLSLRPWYAQLIAVTLFLRRAFGDWCWTAPVIGANIVVDDPYLKRRYGFVHYETLIDELARIDGALTVAFIPYNFRRSSHETTELLLHHSQRFSICVHGCDHTAGEFSRLDEEWLAGTTACALQRMEAHKSLTQMPYDKVMVFPQGRFSTKAIRALKACGMLAAANTSPVPVDHDENPLAIRDLLEPAVTRYESFPIFLRRYPRDTFDYAFDAMFQKPILAVEHHGFFRSGHKELVKLVQDVSSLRGKVRWMPLGTVVRTHCLVRRTGDKQLALRHFAPQLSYKNCSQYRLALSIEKPEQEGTVKAVVVGDQEVPFLVHAGLLKYSAHLAAGEELRAQVVYHDTYRPGRSVSWKYRLAASARRLMSELRDNQLARNEHLLSFSERMKAKWLSRRPSAGRTVE
jgi:hypothetical protein